MSATSEWVYTNVATVWPLGAFDDWTGAQTYGDPYLIACTWTADAKTATNDYGKEFVSQQTIYTESKRNGSAVRLPQRDDYIAHGDMTSQPDPIAAKADKIVTVRDYDMSFFGEDPDYEIMT